MSGQDSIRIEILEDGTIKCTTDPISMPNHVNAEGFLREMARLAGGTSTRTRRLDVHRSLHDAHHEHTKDGHTHQH